MYLFAYPAVMAPSVSVITDGEIDSGLLVGVDTNYSAYYLYPLSLCCWPDAGGLFVIYDARLTYSPYYWFYRLSEWTPRARWFM